jgi:Predicted membrane protein (DUF2142)
MQKCGGLAGFLNRNERTLILLLCLAAALRVFIFAAAFPFFSEVDEDLHFDLIIRYSLGELPRTFDLLSKESLDLIVPYASPEFLQTPDQFPEGKFPPPLWKQSGPETEAVMTVTRAAWSAEINSETSQPPLYYALGAVWWHLGRVLGLTGIGLLYWIRFLNVPLVALLVWLGYVAAGAIWPQRRDVRIGVPLLIAFIPQDVFFCINNDVLSPICLAALLLCVLRWFGPRRPTVWLGAVTGLAISATYLTKLANLPSLIVVVIAIAAASSRNVLPGGTFGHQQAAVTIGPIERQQPRRRLAPGAALLLCATVPIGVWMIWTKDHFGDVTGSTTKIALLGWTRKPFAGWWHHPIFTPRGLWIFWSELLASFWRGEIKWQNQPLRSPIADGFYPLSSLFFLCIGLAGLRSRTGLSKFQRQALAIAGLSFLAAVGFLALLSIQFDFGNCINPSHEHPYFTSGRLMSGAFVPFALVFVYGLDRFCRFFGVRRFSLFLLMVIMALVTASEIAVNSVAFTSEHNWFHR